MHEADKASKGSKGVIMSNGGRWKESRRFALMTMKDFGVGKQSLWERTVEETVALCERLAETDENVMNLKPHFVNSVLNVICSVVFGRRFAFDDPEFKEATEAIDYTLQRAGARSLINFMPWLRFVPFIAKPLDNEIMAIETFIRRKIVEHRESFDASQPPRDFVDMYMQVEQGLSDFDKSIFDEDHMYVLILDLFVGGTETTATTLLWGILFLSLNEDHQKHCREEIHTLLGPDAVPTPEHRGEMPFVEAMILEVERIGDIAPFMIRAATKDTSFKGYRLPKDANMLVLFHSINRDPVRFPEPYEFRPQRWLDDDGKIAAHDDFIPFSTGRRNCLGENLAKMELFGFFVTLLQKFTFSIPEGHPPPSTQGHMGVTRTPHEYEVLVQKIE